MVTKANEKGKSTSSCAIQAKRQRQTISTEEKLNAINQLENGVRIVDKRRNV